MAQEEAPLALTLRAAAFAARVHSTHRRKGAAAEPYVNHVLEVAEILAAQDAPLAAIVAGLLHDTVEDSDADPEPVTLARIEAEFGAEVAGIVAEVSDDKSLPKEVRKGLQVRHAAKASAAAKQVKLADKISNLRTIVASPPAGWGHARRLEYVGWAGRVAAGAKGVNPRLDALFEATYREAVTRLAAED
ncbi:MAG: bifunctional (p)ppGpp synthetase/guanosine-3',5'-bis(diphosphate) 3'-pyrophosphohydrolase [Acetobacteraceae bacterium]|nr:MAG: bifunctional (p)ppGpp synthetase/guanosine-3',5'-bis(diphosphate) 3'-pyrophosphohydrolase [Acetobacteraceae bacterium]